MLRIYDEHWVAQRTGLKRLQALVLVFSGMAAGAWLSGSQSHADPGLANATATTPAALCAQHAGTDLQLSCTLQNPPYGVARRSVKNIQPPARALPDDVPGNSVTTTQKS